MGATGHSRPRLAGRLSHHLQRSSRLWKGPYADIMKNIYIIHISIYHIYIHFIICEFQIVWFTALFPYFVIITLLFKAITLEGAGAGELLSYMSV